MKLLLSLLIVVISFNTTLSAQPIVRFKVSQPYAVFSFLEEASGAQPHSSTFRNYLDSAIGRSDTGFNTLTADFRKLVLSYNYRRDEYPANRRQTRSTYDLMVIAAVKSASIEEFRANTIGILPNSTHQQLCNIMQKAKPYYERFVWNQSAKAVADQIKGFNKYADKANELFRTFRNFYNSRWPDDIPFDVAIFPIPARQGNTSATPHANSLCVAVLTGREDFAGTMGVTMHEICHVLYDEQTSGFQHQLDEVFKNSRSPYKDIAYSFFDESLATALGNGIAYKYFSGKPDTTSWYNNEYIDGFAHAVYPLVRDYIDAHKPIDSAFIEKAIELFGKTYPRSLSDYSVLLNNMFLYSDGEASEDRRQLKATLGKYFQSSRYSFSSPILHEYSIESMKNGKGTQLIVVDRNQDSTISELRRILPELDSVLNGQQGQNYIAAFYDRAKRPVVLVRVSGTNMLDKAFRVLKDKKYLDINFPVFPVE